MKLFKKIEQSLIIFCIVISLMAGFAAGVVGQIVSNTYWYPNFIDTIGQNADTNSASGTAIPELKRVKKFLGIQQDFEVSNSVEKIAPSIVGLYAKKIGSGLAQAYTPKDLLGNAFILTSDGWLVSTAKSGHGLKTDGLVVSYNQKVYPVTTLLNDPLTGIVFIKIAVNNLPVAVLGDSSALSAGQLVLVANVISQTLVTTVKQLNYSPVAAPADLILSSESYSQSLLVSSAIDSSFIGGPVVNLAGEVVGIVSDVNIDKGTNNIVPLNQFQPIIQSVLRRGVIQRPLLGIWYIDLASVIGLDQTITQGLNHGALVYNKPAKDSPAAIAGIQQNDIVISIEGQQIDQESNLTDLIQQYQVGDQIDIEVWRNGKTIPFSIKLGSTNR